MSLSNSPSHVAAQGGLGPGGQVALRRRGRYCGGGWPYGPLKIKFAGGRLQGGGGSCGACGRACTTVAPHRARPQSLQGGGARAACCTLCPLCSCNMRCAPCNLSLCTVHCARRCTHTYTCLPCVPGLSCLMRCVLCQWCTLSLCTWCCALWVVLCAACAHVATCLACPVHPASPTTACRGTGAGGGGGGRVSIGAG